jgi:hypothetical protein
MTSLSGPHSSVAEAVHPARTEFHEGAPMLRRAVAAITLEPVSGVAFGEGAHGVVPDDLRHDAGRGDSRALGVGPRQAFNIGAKRQVAVGEPTSGTGFQG